MRRIISIVITAIALSCLWSCNEKPRHYKFVKRAMDNSEQVETFDAKNDTDALNMFIDRMSAVVIENMNNNTEPLKEMFVISPEGDTLNKNKALLDNVVSKLPASPLPDAPEGKTDTIILGKVSKAD